jgi:hypothetical protein
MDALGGILAPAARVIYEVVQAPDAIVGASVLAAASLATQSRADVVLDGRHVPLSLWHFSIAESGERKTAVDEWALRPHRSAERAAAQGYELELRDYGLAAKAHEAIERARTKGTDAEAVRRDLAEMRPPAEPQVPWLITADPTIEGLHRLLARGRGYGAVFSHDGGSFLGGHAMSRDHRMHAVASLSTLWDRGEFDRVRAGDGAQKFFGRRLALHLLVQPVIAETVLSDELLAGQGFLARCLLAWPPSRAGTRRYIERDLSLEPAMIAYWSSVRALLDRPLRLKQGQRNELDPRPLALTPDAKALWIRIADGIEAKMGERGILAGVRAWASKGAEQILRVAGVLTVIEAPAATDIGCDAIERAGEIVAWHLGEAGRIVGTCSVPPAIRHAEAILAWTRQHHVVETHSAQLLQRGPGCVRNVDPLRKAMEVLVRHGYAVKLEPGTVVDGAPRRSAWSLRP